jgi:DNA replication protein DnaC
MNTQATLDQLRQLKLHGMSQAYEGTLTMPTKEQPTANELIARLSEAEIQYRMHQKTQIYLRLSKLRYDAVLEQVQCSPARNLIRDQLLSISDCSFIQRAQNILITGSTGSGKSYLACAIGRQACMLGYRVMYFGMNRFLEKIAQTKLDGTFLKLLNQIEKIHLIIFDDFGLNPLDNTVKLALLQLLEDRYDRRSTIITSQLPVSKWFEYLGEPTVADAIMDRLSANADRFELKGESLRKIKETKK